MKIHTAVKIHTLIQVAQAIVIVPFAILLPFGLISAIAGCTTTPTKLPAVITEPVVVTRVVYVPIPGELTAPQTLYHRASDTAGEYAKQAVINTDAAQQCNQKLADIASVSGSEK